MGVRIALKLLVGAKYWPMKPPGILLHPIARRRFLQGMGVLGLFPFSGSASAAETIASPTAKVEPTRPEKLKIIVTGGHPGDPEYGCGGTIARYSDGGHDVLMLYLNQGDPQETRSRPASPVRKAEALRAAEILGARTAFAGQIDAHAVIDAEHTEAFHSQIAAEHPDVVFTHWPIDNHADHRAMSILVYDAWRRMGKSFALYYYEVSNGEDTVQFSPTHYVDIGKTEERKRQACFAHTSQSPERYYRVQEAVTHLRGLDCGYRQAESFIHHIQSPSGWLPGGR